MTLLQVISPDAVILRCLFDFSGQEGDELTIQANQVSGLLHCNKRKFVTKFNGYQSRAPHSGQTQKSGATSGFRCLDFARD